MRQGTEYVSLRGAVQVLARGVNEGKATITIADQGLVLMFSKAVPDQLGHFFALLIDKVGDGAVAVVMLQA